MPERAALYIPSTRRGLQQSRLQDRRRGGDRSKCVEGLSSQYAAVCIFLVYAQDGVALVVRAILEGGRSTTSAGSV